MKIKTEELIAELINASKRNISTVKKFKEVPLIKLNRKESTDKWSVLECIEHLNLYGDFYNPEVKKRIDASQSKPCKIFKSGVIGNYFVTSMLPKENLNKMKTFKDKNPTGSTLTIDVIDRFVNQQKDYLDLIETSKNIDLTKTKTAITISTLIKLRLGDTLRFIVAHNQRHIAQAQKALEATNS